MAGHVARMEEGRRVFKIITGKPTGKRPLGRSRLTWVLEWSLKRWVSMLGIRGYRRALVKAALNLRVS